MPVKVFTNGGKALNVNDKVTVEKMSDVTINPIEMMLPDLEIEEYNFPPVSMNSYKFFVCCTCDEKFNAKDVAMQGQLMKCPKCLMSEKVSLYSYFYDIKLVFKNHAGMHNIMMYRHQVDSYFANKNSAVPADENELAINMLSDDKTTVIVNARNVCTGVKAIKHL